MYCYLVSIIRIKEYVLTPTQSYSLTHITRLHNPFYNYHYIWAEVFFFWESALRRRTVQSYHKICYWSQGEKFEYFNKKLTKATTRRIIKWFIKMNFCGRENEIHMCTVPVEKRPIATTSNTDKNRQLTKTTTKKKTPTTYHWTKKYTKGTRIHTQRGSTKESDTRCHPKWTV